MKKPGRPKLLSIAVVAAALAALFLCLLLATGSAGHPRKVALLSKCLPLIQKHKVTHFRNQDWCKNISYSGGRFSDNPASTCNLFSGVAVLFTARALADFKSIADALPGSGSKVNWFEAKLSESGAVKSVTFDVSHGFTRQSYVYSPNYGILPPDQPNETWHTAIDVNWYYVKADWN